MQCEPNTLVLCALSENPFEILPDSHQHAKECHKWGSIKWQILGVFSLLMANRWKGWHLVPVVGRRLVYPKLDIQSDIKSHGVSKWHALEVFSLFQRQPDEEVGGLVPIWFGYTFRFLQDWDNVANAMRMLTSREGEIPFWEGESGARGLPLLNGCSPNLQRIQGSLEARKISIFRVWRFTDWTWPVQWIVFPVKVVTKAFKHWTPCPHSANSPAKSRNLTDTNSSQPLLTTNRLK